MSTYAKKWPRMARIFNSPLWDAGFRPFFILAMVSGVALTPVWALIFMGKWPSPFGNPMQWHAHEMLYGFGWAVLGGFLLTASKNWVKIRGIHGAPLALLGLAWIVERLAVYAFPHFILMNAFILACGGYVFYSLWRYRSQDSFRDNYYFLIGLPLFLVAKNLLLSPTYYAYGVAMSIGLFRLAFAVMFERTTTQFMKNAMGVQIPRYALLDTSIKALVLICVFSAWMPGELATLVFALASALMFARLFTWSPQVGMRNFGISLMYIGHFALAAHLGLEALGMGSLSVHVFTLLCMGVVIPGMLIRISQGHTGRKILFTISDRVALGFMFLAAFFRLVMTQLDPSHYANWIAISAVGWSACFAILLPRLTPYLLRARVDGKTH